MTISSHNTDEHPASHLMALLQALSVSQSAGEIHDLRVSIKRTRAWLRLCRAVTGTSSAYQQLVATLRELSHALSPQRDRDVALQTLANLMAKYPGKKAQRIGDTLSRQIAQEPGKLPDIASVDVYIAQIHDQLPTFTRLTLPRDTQVSVIQHAYTKICKVGDRVLNSATCADLHAWRKRVKRLFYQVDMVDGALSDQHKIQGQLDKLGSRLGEVHDLCVLEEIVEDKIALLKPPMEVTPIFKRIQHERRRLIESCRKHYRHLCIQT